MWADGEIKFSRAIEAKPKYIIISKIWRIWFCWIRDQQLEEPLWIPGLVKNIRESKNPLGMRASKVGSWLVNMSLISEKCFADRHIHGKHLRIYLEWFYKYKRIIYVSRTSDAFFVYDETGVIKFPELVSTLSSQVMAIWNRLLETKNGIRVPQAHLQGGGNQFVILYPHLICGKDQWTTPTRLIGVYYVSTVNENRAEARSLVRDRPHHIMVLPLRTFKLCWGRIYLRITPSPPRTWELRKIFFGPDMGSLKGRLHEPGTVR
jgi:hypothetical protein